MSESADIFVGLGQSPRTLLLKLANRHGLIAGATGTGKTVTLQTLAEGFSRAGVPVFVADVKGDLAGLAQTGGDNPKLTERAKQIGYADYAGEAMPVIFWDLFGQQGHPIRTTVSEIGPLLLSRLLDLNEVQEGVLNVAFKVADDQGLLLLDLKDLRAMLNFVGDNAAELSTRDGQIGKTSIGAIQRQLLVLEQQGAEHFLAEPALDLADFLRQDNHGRGAVNLLAADKLMQSPRLYATFLLWLLSELFENLPEVGDLDKPRLAFIFDEAHLLFDDAPAALQKRIEQVVRLIRSKGVGVYFCSQFPDDVPDNVLGQLGNRIQHALRAYTPRDQKAVKTAAETFVPNPKLDVTAILSQLGTGEALVSTLQDKGVPSPVQQTKIAPPRCRMGAISEAERIQVRAGSPVGTRYDTPMNRESAAERLAARAQAAADNANAPPARGTAKAGDPAQGKPQEEGGFGKAVSDVLFGSGRRQGVIEASSKQAARTITNEIVRGILGGLFGGKKR